MNDDDDDGGAWSRIVRSDDEIRAHLGYARAGIARYGFGEKLHPDDLARPWSHSAEWADNAWLRGVRFVLARVLGEPISPAEPAAPQRMTALEVFAEVDNRACGGDIDEIMLQGHKVPVHPGWPPPQSAEAWDMTLMWLEGHTPHPPVCPHGRGAYMWMPGCDCRDIGSTLTPAERAHAASQS